MHITECLKKKKKTITTFVPVPNSVCKSGSVLFRIPKISLVYLPCDQCAARVLSQKKLAHFGHLSYYGLFLHVNSSINHFYCQAGRMFA